MYETEAKIKVKNFNIILNRLRKLDSQFITQHYEENFIYDFFNFFKKNNLSLRLRFNGEKILTFKGKLLKSKFKKRKEIEFKLNKLTYLVFNSLYLFGLRATQYYSKKRIEYQLNNCIICLDNVGSLGNFIEIEGEGKDISAVLKLLKLEKCKIIKKAYIYMLMKKKRNLKKKIFQLNKLSSSKSKGIN